VSERASGNHRNNLVRMADTQNRSVNWLFRHSPSSGCAICAAFAMKEWMGVECCKYAPRRVCAHQVQGLARLQIICWSFVADLRQENFDGESAGRDT